jgi:hypothetical protein
MNRIASRRSPLPLVLVLLALARGPVEGASVSGVAIGLNYASLGDIRTENVKSTYESRTGTHAGLYAQSALGPLGLRLGAVYMNAGPLFEGLSGQLGGSVGFDDTFDVRFFVVPLDLQYRIPAPTLQPYLLFGPEIRFDLSSADDFDDNLENVVWGGNVGVGFEVTVPFLDLALSPELRYAFDLSDLTKDELRIGGESFALEDGARTGTIHVRLHLGF